MKEIEDMVDEWRDDPACAVIEATAEYFGITREELLSKERTRQFSHPRMLAMVLLRQMTNMTYQQIASVFGRHHSTVIYAENRTRTSLHATQHLAALRIRVESPEEL